MVLSGCVEVGVNKLSGDSGHIADHRMNGRSWVILG